MRCHPGDVDLSSLHMDKEEDVIRHQPAQGPHFGGEEVRGPQHIHVRTNKCLPGRGFATLWRCRYAPTLENIADRLIADLVTQMSQGTRQTVVARLVKKLNRAI